MFRLLVALCVFVSTVVNAADLKPKMFPDTERRVIEQELVNAHIQRQALPSAKTAIYRCEDYDRKIERLVELYDQLNRNEMARQWRVHLGHVWEFSLNFCEDVEHHDRFKVAHKLYREAGDELRMRRVALKESKRLRRLYDLGQCNEEGTCKKKLLKESEAWERRATYQNR